MSRLTLAGAAQIAVSFGLARFALGLFAPEFQASFGLTATGVGWVLAASFGGYLAALALAGAAIERTSARAVALASGVLAILGTAGVAAAPDPRLLAVAVGLGGLSTGWASTALATAVTTQLPSARHSAGQTVINAGTSLGLILAAPAAVLAGATWRAAWLLFALVAIAATVVTAGAVRPTGGWRRQRPPGSPAAWRSSPRLALAAASLGISSAVGWAFGRQLLETAAHLDPDASRMTWLAVGLGGLAGATAGSAARRHGLPAALAVSWTTFSAAYLGLAVGGLGLVGAVAMMAMFGAGYMALTGLLIVWAVRERPDRPGAAVAAAFLALAAGQVVGSPLAGATVDALGLGPAFLAAAVVAALGLTARPPGRADVSRARPEQVGRR